VVWVKGQYTATGSLRYQTKSMFDLVASRNNMKVKMSRYTLTTDYITDDKIDWIEIIFIL
jgi:hypothetical protein